MEILTDSENGKKNWEICQKYNVHSSTVSTILKRKDKIKEQHTFIKLINYFFKFERASFRSSGGRGVDRLLVIGRRDALVTEKFRYREFRYRESRV